MAEDIHQEAGRLAAGNSADSPLKTTHNQGLKK
jgi:hypothetical protein